MKQIFFITLIFFSINAARASEITGSISTNQQAGNGSGQAGGDTGQETQNNENKTDLPERSAGGGTPLGRQSGLSAGTADIKIIGQAPEKAEMRHIQENSQAQTPLVLGISHYPAGALLRDSQKRVYVFDGQFKKHLKNQKELAKYAGQPILDRPDDELAGFPTRVWLDGDLIRQSGQLAVYVIENGRRRHIISLEELRRNFASRDIFPASLQDMDLYS